MFGYVYSLIFPHDCWSVKCIRPYGVLKNFYENKDNLHKIINIIDGESNISLRIVDWFVTNYAIKYFTVYEVSYEDTHRFKVYNDYKLKLNAYSKSVLTRFVDGSASHFLMVKKVTLKPLLDN